MCAMYSPDEYRFDNGWPADYRLAGELLVSEEVYNVEPFTPLFVACIHALGPQNVSSLGFCGLVRLITPWRLIPQNLVLV